jgi:hypothetical protein
MTLEVVVRQLRALQRVTQIDLLSMAARLWLNWFLSEFIDRSI